MPDNSRSKNFDVVIIGGGIAGVGAALSLAKANLNIAIIEKSEICKATSANSLRIMHGGFRYLQNLDFKRSLRSIGDQHFLKQNYPSHMQDLPCVLPLRQFGLRSALPLFCAGLLYRVLVATKTGVSGYKTKLDLNNSIQVLDDELNLEYASRGKFLWYDLLLKDPAAFVEVLLSELEQQQVSIMTATSLESACYTDKNWQLELLSRQGNQQVSAKYIVNAGGASMPNIYQILNAKKLELDLHWLRAVNIITSRKLTSEYGIAFDGNEGSMFFMTPRGKHSAIGTFYEHCPTMELSVSESEQQVMLNTLNSSLPGLNLKMSELLKPDIGLLPAFTKSDGKFQLYGQDQLIESQAALHVLSTKYTTFRSLGHEISKKVLDFL